jgi:hypothetical protein
LTHELFVARHIGQMSADASRTLSRAFALVSLAHPTLTLRDWRALQRYYRKRSPRKAGLIVIEDRRGYAHAVFHYFVERARPLEARASAAGDHRVLHVYDLVIALVPGALAEQALCQCADTVAVTHDCDAIRLELSTREKALSHAPTLLARGYETREITIATRSTNHLLSRSVIQTQQDVT